MPTKIFPKNARNQEVAWLSGDDDWSLPHQVEMLTLWLRAHAATLPSGEYVADIGFCSRKDAGGGGSAFTPETLALMASARMHLYLSEYPGFSDESHGNE